MLNRNLKDLVKKGIMREDFFYRIHVIPINLPPLRDRGEDVHLLIDHFLKLYSEGKKTMSLPASVIHALYNYHWPGNIRELKNVIQRYVTVRQLDFMDSIHTEMSDQFSLSGGSRLPEVIEDAEREMIKRILIKTKWNRSKAAKILGISRKALYRKIKKYESKGINMDDNAHT